MDDTTLSQHVCTFWFISSFRLRPVLILLDRVITRCAFVYHAAAVENSFCCCIKIRASTRKSERTKQHAVGNSGKFLCNSNSRIKIRAETKHPKIRRAKQHKNSTTPGRPGARTTFFLFATSSSRRRSYPPPRSPLVSQKPEGAKHPHPHDCDSDRGEHSHVMYTPCPTSRN